MDAPDVEIDESDVEMQVFRASGAGGQHINKTSSAVRLIHQPTGLVAAARRSAASCQNREKAMDRLKAMMAGEDRGRAPRPSSTAIAGDRRRSAGAARSARTSCSRTRW